MKILYQTPSRLVVTHKEPTTRVVAILLCLAFMLLGPVILPVGIPQIEGRLPAGVNIALIITFLIIVVAALYILRYFETYTFDKVQQTFTIGRISLLGSKQQTVQLRQIQEVYQESHDNNDAIKEYVIIVLHPDAQRVRLPMKLSSFRAEEREQFGELLCSFLGMPARVIQK
jgi:hypothetical protein